MEEEIDDPLEDVFEEFNEEPIAAASIGQVYRARLPDGRDVASRSSTPVWRRRSGPTSRTSECPAPGQANRPARPPGDRRGDPSRIEEELLRLEAQNQRTLARIYRGHPFIVVPGVVTSLSRERVLVSEYVGGIGFEEVKTYPQAARDRVGEILFRFYFGCLYRHHQFSGDPTPELEPAQRRPRRLLRLRPVQADARGRGRTGVEVARAIIEGDTDTIMRAAPRSGSSRNPTSSIPSALWSTSAPPPPGIRSIRRSS